MKDPLLAIITVLLWAVFGRAIISWLLMAGMRNNLILRVDHALSIITEPLMRPLRRVIPTMGAVDVTPMATIILLLVLQYVIIRA